MIFAKKMCLHSKNTFIHNRAFISKQISCLCYSKYIGYEVYLRIFRQNFKYFCRPDVRPVWKFDLVIFTLNKNNCACLKIKLGIGTQTQHCSLQNQRSQCLNSTFILITILIFRIRWESLRSCRHHKPEDSFSLQSVNSQIFWKILLSRYEE